MALPSQFRHPTLFSPLPVACDARGYQRAPEGTLIFKAPFLPMRWTIKLDRGGIWENFRPEPNGKELTFNLLDITLAL